MLDGKQAGKKKSRNAPHEVEMVQTSDNFRVKEQTGEDTSESYAQPKGVQTRAAIARHLAAKLKVGNSKMDLDGLLQAD